MKMHMRQESSQMRVFYFFSLIGYIFYRSHCLCSYVFLGHTLIFFNKILDCKEFNALLSWNMVGYL
jgi:hypothetical protein